MKVKKFSNVWVMGLVLCGVMLVTIYVAKLFFPNFVVEVAQNPRICKIGHFIDNNKWAWYLASGVLSFIIYYFYCGACCRKKLLTLKEVIYILIAIIVMFAIRQHFNKYYTIINYISLILLPCIMKAQLLSTAITFTSINLLQLFTLEIRNIGGMVADKNFATLLILMIDYYIFLVLLYLALNYKKGE